MGTYRPLVGAAHRRGSLIGTWSAVLTDLGYLLLAAFPSAARPFTRYFRFRYRRLAPSYEDLTAAAPGYGEGLRMGLERCRVTPVACADVAAGTGAASRMIRARYPSARVVAVDLSVEMLREWRTVGDMRRIVGAAWALPLASGGLDLAVVQNAPPCFDELARIVRPGGVVLFSLSTAGLLPAGLRGWLLQRALPHGLALLSETAAGRGLTWLFQKRHEALAAPRTAHSGGQSWPAAAADRDC